MKNPLFCAAIAVALFAAVPGMSQAAESVAHIENLTNDPIFVAVAHSQDRDLVCTGWFKIESTKSMTFRADDAAQLCLRVQKKGDEQTFDKHTSYVFFPVTKDGFI